jgi:Ala-tRNA(Pro) deacylase
MLAKDPTMNIHEFLSRQHVPFQRLVHQPAPSSSRRADSVRTTGRQVAKTVLLSHADGQFLMAVLPADKKIDWAKIADTTGKSGWKLATEQQAGSIFNDCETGAWPPFGSLYGLNTVVDDSFAPGMQILVEGNHRHEDFRLSFDDYLRTAQPATAQISRPS